MTTHTQLPTDPNSVADANAFTTKHIDFDWDISFAEEKISGSATLTVQRLDGQAAELRLDASALVIKGVAFGDGSAAAYEYRAQGGAFGGALVVQAPAAAEFTVRYPPPWPARLQR